MILYIIILAIVAILNFIPMKEKTTKKMSLIIFLVLIFISGLRSVDVGTDTLQFWNVFRYININGSIGNYEEGFVWLCKIIQIFTSNPQWLLIVTSIIINLSVYYFIKNNSKDMMFSILLYLTLNLFFSLLCLMRQGLAITFIIISYHYIKKNSFIKSMIFIIIASLFHSSALLLIVLILIKKYNNNNIIIIRTIVISLLAFIFAPVIFNLFVNFDDYSKYVGLEYSQSSNITAPLYTITSFVLLLFGIIVPNKNKLKIKFEDDKNLIFLSNIISIATIISAASIRVGIFNRMYLYFSFFNILWIPNTLSIISNEKNKNLWKFIIIFFTIIYVSVITYMGWYGVYPYSFADF